MWLLDSISMRREIDLREKVVCFQWSIISFVDAILEVYNVKGFALGCVMQCHI